MRCIFCSIKISHSWNNINIRRLDESFDGICSEECYRNRNPFASQLTNCARCGDWSVQDDFPAYIIKRPTYDRFLIPQDYTTLCPTCRHNAVYSCLSCGKHVPMIEEDEEGELTWFDINNHVCQCMTSKCPSCDRGVRERDLFPDGNGCVICRPLSPLLNHDYRPQKFNVMKVRMDTTAQLFFGIELEVHVGNEASPDIIRTMAGSVDKFSTVAYYVHDGSITPGFELVSQPMTLATWKRDTNPIWAATEVLKKYVDKKIHEGHPSCGLHIHMTKSAWTREMTTNLLEFIYFNPRFMILLSKRDFNTVADPRTGKKYCRFDPENKDTKATLMRHDDKYVIINFRNPETIEFRCFKSVLDRAHIQCCIEFCYAMWVWTQSVGKDEAWDIQKFSRYVFQEREMYPLLTLFFERHSF